MAGYRINQVLCSLMILVMHMGMTGTGLSLAEEPLATTNPWPEDYEDCRLYRPDITLAECYREKVERKVMKAWKPRPFPDIRQATVRFVLNRDGELMDIRIKQSSGVPALDESIQRAIVDALPFQPLPKAMEGEEIPLELTFDYIPPAYKPAVAEKKTYPRVVPVSEY